MISGRTVAVIIPARNEAPFIGRVIRTLPPMVDHIIVVDDGSTDGTADRARAQGRPGVTVLSKRGPSGVGSAVVAGYDAALALGADVMVVTNGDGQMSGHELPDLVEPIVRGEADLVKGNRLLCPGTRGSIPPLRRAGIHVLGAMTRAATGLSHLSDAQSGYHAISRGGLLRLNRHALWRGFGFPNDLLCQAAMAGLRIRERPVRAIYGDEVSALRIRHALYPVGWVVVRGWWRRVRAAQAGPQARARDR